MGAPTPGNILRDLAELIDSGVAAVSSVMVMNDPAPMPHFDGQNFTTQKMVTAQITVTYPPDANGAPAISAPDGSPGGR